MDVYPQDLGRVGYQAMLSVRAMVRQNPYTGVPGLMPTPPPRALSRLQRSWTRGTAIPEGLARRASPALGQCRRAIWAGSPMGPVGVTVWAAVFTWMWWGVYSLNSNGSAWPQALITLVVILGGTAFYSAVVRPRRVFRQMHGALSERDVQQLREQVRDPLANEYLSVVELLITLPAVPDADSAKNLRRAVYALDEAIEELPQQHPRAALGDPAKMRDQASRLSDAAQREPDSVVAASLARQSQSLARRAETVYNIAVLLRRNGTLRDEVSEQIEALRTSIAAFSVGSRHSPHDLADLAASIQHVAEEASAIAVARTELESSAYGIVLPVAEAENVALMAWRKVH